jgi:hypothetical protein
MTFPVGSGFYSSPFEGSPFSTEFKKQDFKKTSFPPAGRTSFQSSAIPFPVVGTDLLTGKRDVDILASTRMPAPQELVLPTGNALPSVSDRAREWVEAYSAMSPIRINEYRTMGDIASQQQLKQMTQLYPFLSAAGKEATARSLAASQAYRAFTEQLPSNVQNIMASKQTQATSAAFGEAERARAIAAQQEAAKNYAGRFAGQYIQVG